MIDTIRLLVSWNCNLRCGYCCNNIPEMRAQIRPVTLAEIDWAKYKNVCITGGEPLLFMHRIMRVCDLVSQSKYSGICHCGASMEGHPLWDNHSATEMICEKLIILYTNGLLLQSRQRAVTLCCYGVNALNVGLHDPRTFDKLIQHITQFTEGLPLSVRFHVHEGYTALAEKYPGVAFRFWKLNDCERSNEDRVIITDWR